MEQDQQFEIVGTFNNKLQQFSIHIIPNIDRINITTFTEQKLFELYYSDENISFQWDEQMDRLGYANFVSLWIKKEEFKIFGKQDNIQWLFNLCKGKFIFLQKYQNSKRTVVEQNETGIPQVYKVDDKCNNEEEYFDKILFQNKQQLNQGCTIPEELRVLKLVNQNKCPYLMHIETIQYDGAQFSYSYKQKRLDSLNQFIQKTPSMKLNQVLEIIRQLLQVTHYFESIKLIHNRLDLDNILYSKQENAIQITNFTYSFLENSQPIKLQINMLSRSQQIGHFSPEIFSQQQMITTEANIYQIGILFYIMVFGNYPNGKSYEEIQKIKPVGVLSILKENGLIQEKLTKVNDKIMEMISSMISINPKQRKSPSHYLRSKIFLPFLKEKISRMELQLYFNEIKDDDDTINNENKSLNSIYILKTKFK